MSIRGAFFILITVIVFFYTFKRPKIGMIYFLFLLFLRDGFLMENIPEVYMNWHMPLVSGWLILVSWFAHNVHGQKKIQKPFELILMLLLGMVIFATKRNAYIQEYTFDVFNEYIRMVILVFLMINIIETERDLKQIYLVLISLIAFLVGYSYYRYRTEDLSIAIPSFYVDRNFFAESIVAVLPLAFMFYEENANKIKKFFFLGITALMAAGVILTHSRGGFLALTIVLFFLFLSSRKKITMVIAGLIILALFLPHIGSQWRDRMGTVNKLEQDASAMARVATWKSGINMAKDHPILGVGAGNFNPLVVYYVPFELRYAAGKDVSIHNIFLQILSETGLSGWTIFMLIISACFFGLSRLRRRNARLEPDKRVNLAAANMAGVGLIGFCGAGFFLPGAYYSYIYILFALIIASKRVYSELLTKAEK